MQIVWEDPKNPYDSFILEASAGSGKTYQLSKRFLNLVAAGSLPEEIVTITFTVKAANEMRSRIIAEATRLLWGESAQKEFDNGMQELYLLAQKKFAKIPYKLRPPLAGKKVAELILASTQLLKIATIDAIFNEWVGKFPWESSTEKQELVPKFSMLDPVDLEELNEKAWSALFKNKESFGLLNHVWDSMEQNSEKHGPLGVESHIKELFRLRTFLWQLETQTAEFPFLKLKSLEFAASLPKFETILDVFNFLRKHLLILASDCKKHGEMEEAISCTDLERLIDLRLLTKDLKVHKGTFRAKKQEKYKNEIEIIETLFNQFENNRKIEKLNNLGSAFYKLYKLWIKEREKLKKRKAVIEFNDLSIYCYQLFYGPSGQGAVWLLQKSIKHLLFDEFQDTSLLQWQIFAKLSQELLAGFGASEGAGITSSVFLVGDQKQSIYGFREADPEVMNFGKDLLHQFSKKSLPLNNSYRTSQVVLDFINHVFLSFDRNFPIHKTASDQKGALFIPDVGRVMVCQPFLADEERTGLEKEAQNLAQNLAKYLHGTGSFPVFDRELGGFRALKAKDCCILYRSAVHVDVFEKYLRLHGIPYRREEQKGFFSRCEIDDLLALLTLIVFPCDFVALLTVLKSPLLIANDLVISAMLDEAFELGIDKKIYQEKIEREVIGLYPEFMDMLKNWQEGHEELLPHQLLGQIFTQLDVLSKYQIVFSSAEGELAKKNLIKLIELSLNLEEEGYCTITQFLSRLKELKEKSDIAAAVTNDDVVTLMTIHKAKGLEFPFIFVLECGDAWFQEERLWLQRKKCGGVSFIGRKDQQPVADTKFQQLTRQTNDSLQEECKRLLYVALTRASQYLYLSGHKGLRSDSNNFLDMILANIAALDACSLKENVWILERNMQQHADLKLEEAKPKQKGLLKFSHINNSNLLPSEINCIQPHKGLAKEYRKSDAEPQARLHPKIMAAIGTFVHQGLEYFGRNLAWDSGGAWTKLVRETSWGRREKLNKDQWGKLYELACQEVQQTVAHPTWQKWASSADKISCEVPIVELSANTLTRGSIDLLLEFEDDILVIDYKTSALTNFFQNELNLLDSYEKFTNFCISSGFKKQLWYYCKAMKSLKPQKRVHGYIWFTKTQDKIKLITY